MKILYYSPHPYLNLSSPSGPGTHMREMIRGFREEGHEVAVCILGGEHIYGNINFNFGNTGIKGKIKSLIPDILWQTVKDFNLQFKDKAAGKSLEKVIEDFQPDLIYERGFYMMTSGVKIANQLGIPHILEMNAPFPEEKIELEGKTWLKGKSEKLERIQAEGTNMMVVVSSGLKNYYESKYQALKGKVLVTPNAIDPNNFLVDPAETSALREELGILQDDVVIGFVGSIFPYHGVKDLLLSFGELCENIPTKNIKLLIVGDGETLPELKRIAANSSWNQQVIFTGNIPYTSVKSYIANMDITVLANSKWYCSPIKIFEYGALNKAIVSINTTAVQDVMINGEDGILIDEPKKDLRDALGQLIENEPLRSQFAQSFHDKVLTKHTWNAMAKLIITTFKS